MTGLGMCMDKNRQSDSPTSLQNPIPLTLAGWILVVCAGIYFFGYVTADGDLWGHLLFGRDLWHSGHLPATDPYSFTTQGKPWINHEWAAELAFSRVYTLWGDAGLLIGKSLLGLLTVLGVYATSRYRSGDRIARFMITVLLITALSPGYMIRPQLFSFLLFSLLMLVVYRYLIQGAGRLWTLPLIMALWVNLHGGFLLGWGVLVMICGCQVVTAMATGRPVANTRRLLAWTLAASLATFMNPYGYRLHAFLVQSLSVARDISEWQPLPVWELSYTNTKIMMVLVGGLLWRYRRRLHLWEVAVVLATLVAALRHQRHVPFFGMAATPFLIHYLGCAVADLRRHRAPIVLTRWVWTAVALAMFATGGYLGYRGVERYVLGGMRIIVNPAVYPISAMRFLSRNGFKGDLILPFDWGEYALWHLYPSCRVSIDGRFRTAYPEPVIQDHFFPTSDAHGWRRLLQTYPADILMTERHPLLRPWITAGRRWVYVYSDPLAMVFVRNNDRNARLLKQFYTTGLDYAGLDGDIYFP